MDASLKALGVDAIGLYQFHRPDPEVPFAESAGVLKELLDAGKIRLAGISNASIEQIEIARRILGNAANADLVAQKTHALGLDRPIVASTAVTVLVLTKRRASPARTLAIDSSPGVFAAAFAALIGIGEKLFCAVMA